MKTTDKLVITKTGCWLWKGAKSGGGYAQVTIEKKAFRVHRFLYELLVGRVPYHMQLDHLCRTRHCVNPDHLEPVTAQTNIQRGASANARKTHCKNGHPYSEENTYHRKTGGRACRECRNIWKRTSK